MHVSKSCSKKTSRVWMLLFSACFLLPLVAASWHELAAHPERLDDAFSVTLPQAFAPPGTTRKYPPPTPYQIDHLRLELTILPQKKEVFGQAILSITPKARPLSSIVLDAAELQISGVFVGEKKAAWRGEGQQLHVEASPPLAPGKQASVRIVYRAQPRTGLHFVLPDKGDPKKPIMVFSQGEDENNRFWYPSFDTPGMRFTSETLFTVPKPFLVISNGRLVKTTEALGMITYHHKMEQTHVNYLLSVVVGEFAVYRQVWEGIEIRSLVPPADLDKAARAFENTADMMQFFSEKIGFKYPFAKYDQVVVHDFTSSGMENITATTLTYRTLHDERAHLNERSDHLVAHELVHQWFGDLLTCKDWSHIWLNESFATYFDQLYTEKKWGKDEFDSHRLRSRSGYFTSPYHRPIETRRYEISWDVFDSHSYPKGAAVLHMIRRQLGDDLWWKVIQTYVKRHAFGLVETSDFQRVLEDVTGDSWLRFFDQWLRSPGHPVLRFSWSYDDQTALLSATIEQTQKKPFTFPLPLVVTDHTGKRRHFTLSIQKKSETFALPLPKQPELVEIDPAEDLLVEVKAELSWQRWLQQMKHGSALASRAKAAVSLGQFPNPPEITQALLTTLQDEATPYKIRQAAAEALGEIASKASCEGLRQALRVKDAHVRPVVASSLGRCRLFQPLEALATSLRTDESYTVRTSAVYAIARLRHARSFALLEEAFKQDFHHGTIQAAALQAMVSLEDPRAFPYLQKAVESGHSREVRRTALSAFARLARLLRDKRLSSDLALLLPFLRIDDGSLQREAVYALGLLGDPRAIPHLQRYAKQAPVEGTARHARRSIKMIRMQDSLKDHLRGLGRDLDSIRSEQRKLLERLRSVERIGLRKR